jgi:hypothetical protein
MEATWSKLSPGFMTREAQPGYQPRFSIRPRVLSYRGGFRARIEREDCGTIQDASRPFDYSKHDAYTLPTVYTTREDAYAAGVAEVALVHEIGSFPASI